MGRGRVCAYERVECACMHGERESMFIWKGAWSVRAWGEGGCVHMEGWSVRAWGEGGCVHMEEFECACMGGGRMCAYMEGLSVHAWEDVRIWKGLNGVHGEREMCIWKGLSVHAWGEGGCVYMEGVECACMDEERKDVCI